MKLRNLAIVVAVLAVASIATSLFQGNGDTPVLDPRIGQPLVSSDVIQQTTRIEIDSSSGLAVALEATEPNSSGWVVRNYHDLPADFSKLNTFIQNLRDAEFTRFGSRNPERIERMDFNGQRIRLMNDAGDVLWSAQLGRTLTGGRFVMTGDDETALVASFTGSLDPTPKNWANGALLSAQADDVRSIEVTFPDEEPLHFRRVSATDPWISEDAPSGATIKTGELTSLLNRLVGLRFTETAEPEAEAVVAAQENARHFKLGLESGAEISIALGRKPAPPAEESPEPAGEESDEESPAPEAPKPGPVYAFVEHSTDEALNARMQQRGFQIQEWTFTSLPADREALLEMPEEESPEPEEPQATETGEPEAAAPATPAAE